MASELKGSEVRFRPDSVIVSKTDLKGIITYVNETFLEVSGFEMQDVLGKPHNVIRNDFMPRCVFKLLWDRLKSEQEVFAYVVNRCKNGNYYWVLAHVTPSVDVNGKVLGYHSSRRVPDPKVISETILPLYTGLKAIEESGSRQKDGMQAAYDELMRTMDKLGTDYDRFIFTH